MGFPKHCPNNPHVKNFTGHQAEGSQTSLCWKSLCVVLTLTCVSYLLISSTLALSDSDSGRLWSQSPKAGHNEDIRNRRFEPNARKMRKVPLTPPKITRVWGDSTEQKMARAGNADTKMRLTCFNVTGVGEFQVRVCGVTVGPFSRHKGNQRPKCL